MRLLLPKAYTLVELLIALTLSLLLLFGIAELFQRVGGTMNETRSAMSASAHLNEAALLLREDLRRIPKELATKPKRIADAMDDPDTPSISDSEGYLEIIEGPDRVADHPYVDDKGNFDPTVGDVDDIIGFTVKADPAVPFRGIILGKIAERQCAEIVWFVRGNNLHRRVRLIDDITRNGNTIRIYNDDGEDFATRADLEAVSPEDGQYAIVKEDETTDGGKQRYDAVDGTWRTLFSLDDLARRARRLGHDGVENNSFPHPLYEGAVAGWQYLRMPTWEETNYWRTHGVQYWKTSSAVSLLNPIENPDLWEQPHFFPDLQDRKSGSLVTDGDIRAGDDIVLTNVLSFDVKVWDSLTKDFVDLGTENTAWATSSQSRLPNTWDSWTQNYIDEHGNLDGLPPYAEPLVAIQITIRCFDPASKIIKQVTVVHRFRN